MTCSAYKCDKPAQPPYCCCSVACHNLHKWDMEDLRAGRIEDEDKRRYYESLNANT